MGGPPWDWQDVLGCFEGALHKSMAMASPRAWPRPSRLASPLAPCALVSPEQAADAPVQAMAALPAHATAPLAASARPAAAPSVAASVASVAPSASASGFGKERNTLQIRSWMARSWDVTICSTCFDLKISWCLMSCFLANPFSFATRKERIRMIRYGLCFKTVAVNSGGDPTILQGAFPTCPIYSSTQRPSQPFPQVPNVRPPSKAKLCQAKATWRQTQLGKKMANQLKPERIIHHHISSSSSSQPSSWDVMSLMSMHYSSSWSRHMAIP